MLWRLQWRALLFLALASCMGPHRSNGENISENLCGHEVQSVVTSSSKRWIVCDAPGEILLLDREFGVSAVERVSIQDPVWLSDTELVCLEESLRPKVVFYGLPGLVHRSTVEIRDPLGGAKLRFLGEEAGWILLGRPPAFEVHRNWLFQYSTDLRRKSATIETTLEGTAWMSVDPVDADVLVARSTDTECWM